MDRNDQRFTDPHIRPGEHECQPCAIVHVAQPGHPRPAEHPGLALGQRDGGLRLAPDLLPALPALGMDRLVLLTDVDRLYLAFGTTNPKCKFDPVRFEAIVFIIAFPRK